MCRLLWPGIDPQPTPVKSGLWYAGPVIEPLSAAGKLARSPQSVKRSSQPLRIDPCETRHAPAFFRGAGQSAQIRPMDESLRAQIETYRSHLDGLIRRGCEVRDTLAADRSNGSAIAATRAWQEDCGVTINQLSGGSKAHWLARSFSEAFLMRSADGRATTGAQPVQIINRLLGVLEQAVGSLSRMEDGPVVSASPEAPPPRRFDFVHDPELRPVVEQAYTDGRRAFEQGDYDLALRTCCGILEAIVIDALEYKGLGELPASDTPAGRIADWSFETRLAVAEKMGLIRGGCARLPAVARTYRDLTNTDGDDGSQAAISERDARLTGQVLHVVMRDLNPGR